MAATIDSNSNIVVTTVDS